MELTVFFLLFYFAMGGKHQSLQFIKRLPHPALCSAEVMKH